MEEVRTDEEPVMAVKNGRGEQVRKAKFKIGKMAEVMGWKAVGAKLIDFNKSVQMEWIREKTDPNQTELF